MRYFGIEHKGARIYIKATKTQTDYIVSVCNEITDNMAEAEASREWLKKHPDDKEEKSYLESTLSEIAWDIAFLRRLERKAMK